MFRGLGLILISSLLLSHSVWAAPAAVEITMRGGLVSVVATDATLPEILAEWSRVGGTTIVNAEKIQTGRVTLELKDVPEKEALAILLRPISGYLAVQRRPDSPAVSNFDRILILPAAATPTASVVRTAPQPMFQPPPAPTSAPTVGGVTRILGPGGEPVPDDQDGAPPFIPVRAPQGYSRGDEPGNAPPQPGATPPAPVGTRAPGMIVPAPAPAPSQPPQQAPPAQPSR